MSKREHRATSKAANDSMKEHKAAMFQKIKSGLEKLRVGGTFEEIAAAANLKPSQVWKRLSEMEKHSMVYTVGVTRMLSSGRKGMVWQLVGLEYKEGVLPEPVLTITSPEKRKSTPTEFSNPLFI